MAAHVANRPHSPDIMPQRGGPPGSLEFMPPSFVIAGAPRAGTTWLYRNLEGHAQVFLAANKEPRYYAVREGENLSFAGPGDARWLSHLVRGRKDYEALFAAAREDQLRGEASSDYLYRSRVAAARLSREAPAAKLIFILRDPALRAHSNWLQHVQRQREPLSFAAALDAEAERIERGWAWWWHYARRGFYAEQLGPFLDAFPEDQVLVLLHDDLRRDPRALLGRVCAFLGIEPLAGGRAEERQNASLVARSPAHGALRRALRPAAAAAQAVLPERAQRPLRRWYGRRTLGPALSGADFDRLARLYADDVERLATMTGLDLSGWLSR
jgi:hypothetical protein